MYSNFFSRELFSMSFTAFQYTPVSLAMLATDTSTLVNLMAIYEWYVENGDTRTLANL